LLLLLPLIHLLAKSFFGSFVNYCPKELLEKVENECISPFVIVVFNRLNDGWKGLLEATNAGKNEKLEVIEEKMLRDLTREWIQCIGGLFKFENNAGETGRELMKLMGVAVPLVYTLLGCFHWPDSLTVRRAVRVAMSVVPAVIASGNAGLCQLVAHDLFVAALKAIMRRHLQDHHPEIYQLIRDIFVGFFHISPLPANILASIPEIAPKMETFVAALLKETDEKKQRNLFRQLLSHISSIDAKIVSMKERAPILDLPGQVTTVNMHKPTWEDANEDLGIERLWDG
jgi:hypothetical protein